GLRSIRVDRAISETLQYAAVSLDLFRFPRRARRHAASVQAAAAPAPPRARFQQRPREILAVASPTSRLPNPCRYNSKIARSDGPVRELLHTSCSGAHY